MFTSFPLWEEHVYIYIYISHNCLSSHLNILVFKAIPLSDSWLSVQWSSPRYLKRMIFWLLNITSFPPAVSLFPWHGSSAMLVLVWFLSENLFNFPPLRAQVLPSHDISVYAVDLPFTKTTKADCVGSMLVLLFLVWSQIRLKNDFSNVKLCPERSGSSPDSLVLWPLSTTAVCRRLAPFTHGSGS